MFVRKRTCALIMAGLILFGFLSTAQAVLEVSEDYMFTVNSLADKSVIALMGNKEQRLLVSSIILAAAAENIGGIRTIFEEFDSRTKVYIASSPVSSSSIELMLFTIDYTWVFTGSTMNGQILVGTMNYTIVPGAAEMIMSSFKSDGSIEDYYEVSFTDIVNSIFPTFGIYPMSTPRIPTPASLNQRMATRSGPGTKYTEELGTLPQDTVITLIETVTTHGTPWAMVEFNRNGMRYRAYTGMKRINAYGPVAQGTLEYYETILPTVTVVYYGPGYDYAQRMGKVPAGTLVQVYDTENGFTLCDYQSDGKWVRAYFPML